MYEVYFGVTENTVCLLNFTHQLNHFYI